MHWNEGYGNAKDFPFDLFATLQKEILWSFNIIEILNTYLVSFIVTKNQITNLKLINSNFCCDNSKKTLFFWFAKTTKIKTKKFGIWFLVTGILVYIEIHNFILSFDKIERNKLFQTRSSCKDFNHNGMMETETNTISNII